MDPTRLIFPALRWQDGIGFGQESPEVRDVLERGVGGFILFGGPATEVDRVVGQLREKASHPLLFGADLERGAGQQFEGCTSLPPAAALGSLDDVGACWNAGNLTAREARALGVGWVYAPVADRSNELRNPIVGTRAFGSDPGQVARCVAAWIRGCREGGALACAKHFPGHGRTLGDSHQELPVVTADEAALSRDLMPFAAAIEAGVSSIMTAHVAYPALDPSGAPATRSRSVLQDLLRGRLGFEGLVVTDALMMEGATAGTRGELAGALQALDAGVDALLYPRDPSSLSDGLRTALSAGRLNAGRVLRSVKRIASMAESVEEVRGLWGRPADWSWSVETARRTLQWVRRGEAPVRVAHRRLIVVDDDVGGPYPSPSRRPLVDALVGMGVRLSSAPAPGEPEESETGRDVVALFCDPRGWKGRSGLSEESRRAVQRWAPEAELVLLFAPPHLVAELPGRAPVLCAWGGEALMQRTAAAEVAGIAGHSPTG